MLYNKRKGLLLAMRAYSLAQFVHWSHS